MKLSIVSPVYFGETLIVELVKRIKENIKTITDNYEIILIEDGSPDNSWDIIQSICKKDNKIKGIKLSRNFGQHYAITAGLEVSLGELVIVMDCDLQDRPEEISKLVEKANLGFDIVFARRELRQDSFLKRQSSKLFYRLFSYLTDTKQDPAIANFGIYNQKVIRAVLSMQDHIRYFPTMLQWVGFSKTYINVEHDKRLEGRSSYTWKKLFALAFDNIISFSNKPLRLTIKLGFFMSLTSAIVGFYYLALFILDEIIVKGYTSLIISIWFLSGLLVFILGMIGLYIGKTFDRVKNRPVFIIENQINI